jgi:O-antigen/teichoic acid export membrane protein
VASDELRRLGRRAIIVNLGWVPEAVAGFVFVGYAIRVLPADRYGVLVFATTIAGLLMLMDLGTTGLLLPAFVRSSVRGSTVRLAALFSTSLAALAVAGAFALLLAAGIALLTPAVTHSDTFATPESRSVIILLGLTAAVALPLRAYEILFEAHARYGTLACARAAAAMLRLFASIVAVSLGYGIVGVAVVGVATAALRLVAFAAATRLVFPDVAAFAPRDWSLLRRLAKSAGWVAVDNTSRQVMMMSDAALLAFVAPVQAVALYGVASRVPLLAWNATGKALGVSTQAASEHDSVGNDAGVLDVFRSTALLAVTIVWPLLLVLIVFSDPFLRTWAGDAYVGAAPTMRWLLVAGMAFALHNAAHGVLYARNRVDVIAKITVVEAAANVVLSLVLGYRYGAVGPALATALTLGVATIAFFVPAACRSVNLPVTQFARTIVGAAALPMLLVTVAGLAVRTLVPSDRPLAQCAYGAAVALLCAARLPLLVRSRRRQIAGPPSPQPVVDAG